MSKIYVIGDIHGCYDEFIELTQQIGITDEDLIISLGDIVDRGNKSLELYHYFKNRQNSIVLMGNHERKHLNGVLSYAQEIVKVQFGNEYEEFIQWLETLPYYYDSADALIVHAFFEHDKEISEQKEEVLAGSTSGTRYLEQKYEEGQYWSDFYCIDKPIIYGHHVVGEAPKIKNNTYGIDTGACHAGKLTAIELPGFTIHQVKVKRDHWKEQQSIWQIPVLRAKDWEGMKLDQVYKLIEKLSYKEEPDVKEFLQKQKKWIDEIENLIEEIRVNIEELMMDLQTKFADNFNQEAAKLKFRTLIFKAKTGNLTTENIRKTLDTPQKLIDLAHELNIEKIPKRM